MVCRHLTRLVSSVIDVPVFRPTSLWSLELLILVMLDSKSCLTTPVLYSTSQRPIWIWYHWVMKWKRDALRVSVTPIGLLAMWCLVLDHRHSLLGIIDVPWSFLFNFEFHKDRFPMDLMYLACASPGFQWNRCTCFRLTSDVTRCTSFRCTYPFAVDAKFRVTLPKNQ